MSSKADGWTFPNQNLNLADQFAAGARAFMLDVHVQDNALVSRHGPEAARFLGWKPFGKDLASIRSMLDGHPDQIVTVILESYAPAKDVAEAFGKAGLADMARSQQAGQAWPTLEQMVAEKKRLVVFTDRPDGGPAWMMPVWDQAWETPFEAHAPADLKNVPNRGKKTNALLILNHFLSNPMPSPDLAGQVNRNPFLSKRLDDARTAFGRRPNFVTVDFLDIGDVAAEVGRLNATEK